LICQDAWHEADLSAGHRMTGGNTLGANRVLSQAVFNPALGVLDPELIPRHRER
jgi:hypothetical protein